MEAQKEQEQEPKIPNVSGTERDNLKPMKKKTKPEPVPFQIVTRAANAKLNAFAFELLPPELKENVFKFLALSDLKSVRLVSRDWKIIAYRYIGIKTAHLDDSTIPVLKNCRYIVRELSLACLKDGRALRCFVGNQIQTLELKYPKISSAALKCLFKACPNLEQLQILHFQTGNIRRTKSDLLRQILRKSMPACSNLKQLKLKIFPESCESIREFQPMYFDFSSLQECKKLEVVNVVTIAPLYFRNIGPVAKALKLKNFSFLYLAEISNHAIVPSVDNDLWNQLDESGLQVEDKNVILPTQEQLDQLQEYFPRRFAQDPPVSLENNPEPSKLYAILLENLREISQEPFYSQYKNRIISLMFSYGVAQDQAQS